MMMKKTMKDQQFSAEGLGKLFQIRTRRTPCLRPTRRPVPTLRNPSLKVFGPNQPSAVTAQAVVR